MPIKICFISGYFGINENAEHSQGGAEYQNYLLALELIKKEYEVVFISYGKKKMTFVEDNGIQIHFIKKKKFLRKIGKLFIFDIFKVLNALFKIQPDIIYQRTALAYTYFPALYKIFSRKTKFIWAAGSTMDVEKNNFSKNNLLNYIDKKIAVKGIKHADKIIVQTKEQGRLLRKNYDINYDVVIPNYHNVPKQTIKKNYEDIFIIWVGNLTPNKQPHLFIEIAKHFVKKPQIKFVAIGQSYSLSLAELCKDYMKVNPNFQYLGYLEQNCVNEIMNKSHILINTSLKEGFPNVFIQAWLRKVVVVSLNVDPDNIIINKNLGYTANGNFYDLLLKIDGLTDNLNLLQSLSQNSFKYASLNHNIEVLQNEFIRIIEKV